MTSTSAFCGRLFWSFARSQVLIAIKFKAIWSSIEGFWWSNPATHSLTALNARLVAHRVLHFQWVELISSAFPYQLTSLYKGSPRADATIKFSLLFVGPDRSAGDDKKVSDCVNSSKAHRNPCDIIFSSFSVTVQLLLAAAGCRSATGLVTRISSGWMSTAQFHMQTGVVTYAKLLTHN